jgi:hypothetical protein
VERWQPASTAAKARQSAHSLVNAGLMAGVSIQWSLLLRRG